MNIEKTSITCFDPIMAAPFERGRLLAQGPAAISAPDVPLSANAMHVRGTAPPRPLASALPRRYTQPLLS